MGTCYVVTGLGQEIESVPDTGYAPFYYPAEGDYLPFFFTDETFTKVLSALINGAFMTYGNEGMQVIWYFLQNVEYPVSFCDLVAEAITECEDVQNAIAYLFSSEGPVTEAVRNFVTGDPAIIEWFTENGLENVLTSEQRGSNLLKPEVCGYGYIFNEVSVFVDLMNTLTIDLFESIEIGSNIFEQAAIFAGLMGGGAGTQAAQTLLNVTDQLVSFAKEEYEGAYDASMFDELRCGLFCLVKDDCDFFLDRAFNYYTIKLDTSLPANPIETLAAVLQFLAAGDYPGEASVYAMHLLVISALRTGKQLLGIDFSALGLRLLAAGDDEDNDWEILCEDCNVDEWCFFQDTTSDVSNMELVYTQDGYGYVTAYSPGVGILGAQTGALDENIPKIVLPAMRVLNQVSFDIDVTSDTSGALAYLFIDGVYVDSEPLIVGPQTVAFAIDHIPAAFVMVGVDRSGADRRQVGPITAWQLVGDGSNPFGTDNCV